VANRLRLDHKGLAEVLKWETLAVDTMAAARRIAEGAHHTTRQGVTVRATVIRRRTTDRVGAVVALSHPAGAAIEAKYGVLAKAASAAGMPVKAKSRKD
jgi:hypothetical protein